MLSDIEKSIAEIKDKLRLLSKDKNKQAITEKLGMNKNYFSDLSKKKNFTITELVLLSQEFNYDFFVHIHGLKSQMSDSLTRIEDKKTRISVVIEVNNTPNQRIILEQIMDKQSVKRILDE